MVKRTNAEMISDDRRERRQMAATLRAPVRARRRAGLCITCGGAVTKGRRYCKSHLSYYRERDRERKKAA